MHGGLHTEMALWKTVGDILKNSGITSSLVEADIVPSGIAESILAISVAFDEKSTLPPNHFSDLNCTSCFFTLISSATNRTLVISTKSLWRNGKKH